jgi:hypothetical protein
MTTLPVLGDAFDLEQVERISEAHYKVREVLLAHKAADFTQSLDDWSLGFISAFGMARKTSHGK